MVCILRSWKLFRPNNLDPFLSGAFFPRAINQSPAFICQNKVSETLPTIQYYIASHQTTRLYLLYFSLRQRSSVGEACKKWPIRFCYYMVIQQKNERPIPQELFLHVKVTLTDAKLKKVT